MAVLGYAVLIAGLISAVLSQALNYDRHCGKHSLARPGSFCSPARSPLSLACSVSSRLIPSHTTIRPVTSTFTVTTRCPSTISSQASTRQEGSFLFWGSAPNHRGFSFYLPFKYSFTQKKEGSSLRLMAVFMTVEAFSFSVVFSVPHSAVCGRVSGAPASSSSGGPA